MLDNITIRKGTFKEARQVFSLVPEFVGELSEKDFLERVEERIYLILIACEKDKLVGFKIGYDRWKDGSFYSWLGGVIPEYRRQGIARQLASMQENWVKLKGFEKVIVKTRNSFREMVQFLIASDYKLVKVDPREDIRENRLIFEKDLLEQSEN